MDEQQKQTIFDLPKVIAVGIASPVATLLTSRFGVAGTLIGLALSAVILTALADFLKVYLARAPATVAKVPQTVKLPGGLRTRSPRRKKGRGRLRALFARFSSLPPAPTRRRSILIGSVIAAGISFLVGLSAVTALERGVGKSLSCWVWDDCPAGSSADGGRTSLTSALPSALGGGQGAGSDAPEFQPPTPQQPGAVSPEEPDPGAPESPSQPEGVLDSEQQQPDSSQPGQRWGPSGISEDAEQRPSSSEASEEDEQRSPADGSEEEDQRQEDQPPSGSDPEVSE